jgi:hypothetical protein
MKKTISFLLFCFIAFTINAQTRKSVQQRTAVSDLVVEGKVVECQSFWNEEHSQIFTSNLIQVFKLFKGNLVGDKFEIITNGGMVDDRFTIVSHQTTLKEGMEGVFFCKIKDTLSNLGKTANKPSVMVASETGFIQYYFERFNPPAADKLTSYKNLKNDIWDEVVLSCREPVRTIKPNTLESKVQKIFNIFPEDNADFATGPVLSFTFKNVSFSNNYKNITFDVFAKCSETGIKFGKSKVFVDYSSEVFGENAVAAGKIIVSKGDIIQNSAYSIASSDASTETVLIDVTSSFTSPSDAHTLTTIEEQFCHVELEIESLLALANIGFDQFQMSGNSWYYDPTTSRYLPFERVSTEGPIKGAEDPNNIALINYEFDNISVSESGTDKFLEFDINGYSNVPWTRLSFSSVFFSYDTTAFGYVPQSNGGLTYSINPALRSLGYDSAATQFLDGHIRMLAIQDEPDSLKYFQMPTTPVNIFHCKLKILNCDAHAGIGFSLEYMNIFPTYYYASLPVGYIEYSRTEEALSSFYDQVLCKENAPIITNIYPKSISAGIRDTLTIEGKGFITDDGVGRVFFRDAGFTDSMVFNHAYIEDYILYTDTLIKLYVPSSLVDSDNGAASGKVKVENNLNGIATSDDPINIVFSVTNIREPDTAYRISFINQNGLGGYTFEMDYQLELEGAGPCIKKAVETWKCLTGVNWSSIDSATVITNFSSDDGKCVVFTGDTIPPDSSGGFLMRTYLAGYKKSCDNGSEIVYYIDNMDIEVNPYYNFTYDCSDVDTLGGIHDFYSILLHEFGHCHMLEHNVEDDEIMFTQWNEYIDAPDFNDIIGGKNVIEFSLGWQSTGACSSISIHDTVSCKTNFVFENYDDKFPISIFPNPFLETFNIRVDANYFPSLQINVSDMAGRSIFSKNLENAEQATQSVTISLSKEIPPGPYIIRITTKNNSFGTIIIKG